MTSWIWLNLALGAVFVLAIAGIPLWMVIRRPDVRHELEHGAEHAVRAMHAAAARAEAGHAPRQARPAYANRAGQNRQQQAWNEPNA